MLYNAPRLAYWPRGTSQFTPPQHEMLAIQLLFSKAGAAAQGVLRGGILRAA